MPTQIPDDPSRRRFVTALAAAGFAAAVRPVGAETIVTPSSGLTAGMVHIPSAGVEVPAYRAMPQGRRNAPLILVVQEIFGVHEHIRDICRRLAQLGYCAIAPELYFRQGDVSTISDIPRIISEVVSRVPDAQVMADLDATLAWAGAQDIADTQRVGITGFCWGGRIAWLYCAHNPQLKAGVAWYGKLEGPSSELTPKHPLDLAAQLRVPVLGLYGGADAGIPVTSVERMREAIATAHGASELVVYPDTPHAFNADYRPSYRPTAAADGWKRMRAWFDAHGLAV